MKQYKEIIRLRLQNQLLATSPFKDVYDVVKWMGAVQAQDYLGSLWALGLRIPKSTEVSIEKAIAERKIVRSWPMRGTLHYTPSEDLRWMQSLLAPRIVKKAASVYRQAELDNKIFLKSAKLITKALESNPVLTRDELYQVLEKEKISTGNTRGLHILVWAAHQGLICQANRQGKQFTFSLVDNWIPTTKPLDKEEALSRLAKTYFRSHGPATVHDFAWWTGLTISEAKQGIDSEKGNFSEIKIEKQSFWFLESTTAKKISGVHLLPAYDEYTVAYKDRSAFLEEKHMAKARNGIFSPCILLNGQIAGTWKRTLGKNNVHVETTLFTKISLAEKTSIQKEIIRYEKFLGI